jgi:membrane protein implicated in regulation of membrane protease activity
MHFALLFLILAALAATLFPDWGWPAVLGSAFAVVVALRLLLMLVGRRSKSADDAAN